jgi:hypothetical protein
MRRKLCLPFLVFLIAWPQLSPTSCSGTEPIYDESPAHPWNKLRRTFYSHTFSNGEVYEHDAALDPPWSNWAPFYNDQAFHAQVVAILEEFLAQPEDQLQGQQPLRRAIMVRDLWPVLDAQTKKHLAKGEDAADRQATLRGLLAKAMARLKLSAEEVKQLPDNYQTALEKGLFPTRFDAASPKSHFLPPDLFKAEGAWVPFATDNDQVGAVQHITHSNYRTVFVPMMRAADDRQVTLDFLSRYTKSRGKIAVPDGTVLALVRRTVLPATSGELMVTPLMESLQLIVVNQAGDHRFKFVLDRAAMLNGGNGLRPVTEKEPVDAYAFESGGLHPHYPNYDADGERLVFGRYAGPASRGMPSLNNCIACHGKSVGRQLFANTHASSVGRAIPTTFDEQANLILSQKQDSFSWGMYQALRDAYR